MYREVFRRSHRARATQAENALAVLRTCRLRLSQVIASGWLLRTRLAAAWARPSGRQTLMHSRQMWWIRFLPFELYFSKKGATR